MWVGIDSSTRNYSGVHQYVLFLYIYIYFVNRTILAEYNRSGVRLFRFWTFAKYSKFLPFPQDGLDHEESGGNDRPQLLVSEGLRPGMQVLIILENNGLK